MKDQATALGMIEGLDKKLERLKHVFIVEPGIDECRKDLANLADLIRKDGG